MIGPYRISASLHSCAFRVDSPALAVKGSDVSDYVCLRPAAAAIIARTNEAHSVAMDTFTKIQYILLCLVIPAAWGLLIEWFFHVNRRLF